MVHPFGLSADREGWWFENSGHNCEFACQQRVLKTFPGPGYFHSDDGVVYAYIYIYMYIYIYIYPSERAMNTKIFQQ